MQPLTVGKVIDCPHQGFERRDFEGMIRGLRDELVGKLRKHQAQIDQLREEMATNAVGSSTPQGRTVFDGPGCPQAPAEAKDAVQRQESEQGPNQQHVSRESCKVQSPDVVALVHASLPRQASQEGIDSTSVDFKKLLEKRRSIFSDAENQTRPVSDAADVTIDSWRFRESCWDAAAFVCHSGVTWPLESFILLLLLLLNVTVQMSFVIIVWVSLAKTALDQETIEGYHFWRTTTGHSVQFMDALTSESLSSRVCRGDSSLHIRQRQAQEVHQINAYLYDHWPFNGALMCAGALLTWTLTISKELKVLASMASACLILPKGVTIISADRDCKLTLRSLSASRMGYLSFVCLLRASIAVVLLVAGAKYLAMTQSIEDIILNTVALEFVLNIDELMYNAVVPIKTRRLILVLQPVWIYKAQTICGLDARMFISLGMIFGFLVFAVVTWMGPQLQRMRDAKQELCGGALDFSYTLNAANYVIWATQPESLQDMELFQGSSRYQIVRSIVHGTSFNDTVNFKVAQLQGPGWSVVNFNKWGIGQIGVQVAGLCWDMESYPPGVRMMALASIRDEFGNQSIATCADVASYCNHYYRAVVRLWCPRTCNCDRFAAAIALPFKANGCPQPCMHSAAFKAERLSAQCVQFDKHVLTSMKIWQDLVANWIMAVSDWVPEIKREYTYLALQMRKHGCDAHGKALSLLDACDDANLRPIVQWCPFTCQCSATFNTWCPRSCLPNSTVKTYLSNVAQHSEQ